MGQSRMGDLHFIFNEQIRDQREGSSSRLEGSVGTSILLSGLDFMEHRNVYDRSLVYSGLFSWREEHKVPLVGSLWPAEL